MVKWNFLSVKVTAFLALSFFLLTIGLTGASAAPIQKQIPFTKMVSLLYPKTYQLRFTLWDNGDPEDAKGVQLWSESLRFDLKGPVLKHTLGTVTPGSLDSVDFSQQLWVQVERIKRGGSGVIIGGRTPLIPAPYALWSEASKLPSCPAGQVLVSTGPSQWTCELLCLGEFIDPLTDADNCGACGVTCTAGPCANGICETVQCAPGCDPSWLGDGFCDPACNVPVCNYDNGDCNCAPGCDPSWLGDGFCDPACNVPACNYDNGDCQ